MFAEVRSEAAGHVIVEFADDGYISKISRVLPDGSTAWEKVPEPKDAFVAVSLGVFDRLTWNTYSAYHVRANLLTGEEMERRFTKGCPEPRCGRTGTRADIRTGTGCRVPR
jgi:hypothetical protein